MVKAEDVKNNILTKMDFTFLNWATLLTLGNRFYRIEGTLQTLTWKKQPTWKVTTVRLCKYEHIYKHSAQAKIWRTSEKKRSEAVSRRGGGRLWHASRARVSPGVLLKWLTLSTIRGFVNHSTLLVVSLWGFSSDYCILSAVKQLCLK